MESIYYLYLMAVVHCTSGYDLELVYKWQYLDYDWPNQNTRNEFIANGSYIEDNVRLGNVRVFNGNVYVTIPRLQKGVPSSLNVLVNHNDTGAPLLQPFPNWEMHQGTTCDNLKFVSAFEIDPNTGWMWIVDTGYYPDDTVRPEGEVKCPAKLIIIDTNNKEVINQHVFPGLVVGSYGKFYLSDIVLDFVDDMATHAYITDTFDWKLIVYDHRMNNSFSFIHPTMNPDLGLVNITVSNKTETVKYLGIKGIAISQDFQYVYYSAVAGQRLFRVPTFVLRDFKHDSVFFAANVREIGKKISIGEGLYCSRKNTLYYSAPQAIYQWPLEDTLVTRDPLPSNMTYAAQSILVEDSRLEWVISPTIDTNKTLWFLSRTMGMEVDNMWNYFVWRMNVNEKGYMDFSIDNSKKGYVQGSVIYIPSVFLLIICCAVGITLSEVYSHFYSLI